jgi:single-stranded DNA-binding protein|tara:strand:- start:2827 stop:3135 length:309 start_codon:yes stop_codon:yes gene_type:complete
MNNCTFTGYLLDDPVIDNKTEGASCCTVKMVTYEYRKNKRGEKKKVPTTITLQAWASGAETIVKLGKKGTKMTVYASARNETTDGEVVFRVNEFDFGCLDKE